MTVAMKSPIGRRAVVVRSALETVPATEHHQTRPSLDTAECPDCGKPVVGAAIVDSPDILRDPLTLIFHRSRRIYCDHCNQIVHWVQACTKDGRFLPTRICGPTIYRNAARTARFLREHPEAAGVADSEGHY